MVGEPASPGLQSATPEMDSAAGELIYMTMGIVVDHLLGNGQPGQARIVLSRLFRSRENIFSHQLADAVVGGGKAVGLLLSAPGRPPQRLRLANNLSCRADLRDCDAAPADDTVCAAG
jgi:hypothetical protein